MRQPRNVVVVGAGAGGLASAIAAAAAGFEVTVVERASTPGGKMRQLMVGENAIDAGPTVLTMRWVFERLFSLGGAQLSARIGLTKAGLLARHAWRDGARLDLFANIEESARAIAEFSDTANAAGYRRFVKDSAAMFDTLKPTYIDAQRPGPLSLMARIGMRNLDRQYALKPLSTMWAELGTYFSDRRLQQLFGRYATYCGSSPFRAPATLMLIAHVEQDGVWLVDGGMHAMPLAMERLARDLGVRFRYGADVDRFDIAGARVAGVRLADGDRLPASDIVYNGDVAALPGLIGESGAGAAGLRPPEANARSLSAVTFAMTARAAGFPLAHHSIFFSDDSKSEFETLTRRKSMPGVPTTYICAQDRNHAGRLEQAGSRERLLFILNAPANGDQRDFTSTETSQCLEDALNHLEACGLSIDRRGMEVAATTPDQFHRLYPATGGALYGPASHGWMASFRRPGARSRIEGLYLAGGSVHPGPGVPMATLSGLLAAEALVADRGSMPSSRRAAISGGMLTG